MSRSVQISRQTRPCAVIGPSELHPHHGSRHLLPESSTISTAGPAFRTSPVKAMRKVYSFPVCFTTSRISEE